MCVKQTFGLESSLACHSVQSDKVNKKKVLPLKCNLCKSVKMQKKYT